MKMDRVNEAIPGMESNASGLLGLWVVDRPSRTEASCSIAKRSIDVIISVVALLALSPAFAVISLAVKITSPGPVFYRCEEVGEHGRRFAYYKFRTMVVGADNMRHLLSDQNEMTGPFFKLHNDPRVTTFGRLLRRFSLDELPQLWNVLKGEMSLVGPRPTQPFEFAQLEDSHKRRTTVKPGLICLWHIQGRSNDFDEMVKMDLQYIDNWSLWLDLRILRGAAWYILSGRNY